MDGETYVDVEYEDAKTPQNARSLTVTSGSITASNNATKRSGRSRDPRLNTVRAKRARDKSAGSEASSADFTKSFRMQPKGLKPAKLSYISENTGSDALSLNQRLQKSR